MMFLTPPADFGPLLDIAARSCAGAGSPPPPENQDNYIVIDATGRARFLDHQQERTIQVENWPRGQVRVAVLDGMGGHGNGRQAAQAAAEGLLRMPACATLEQLGARLDALHRQLQADFARDNAQGAARPPGTTLTLLELRPGLAPLLYHVGDSRLYEISSDQALPLTVDHVPATAFAMRGLLGEEEWWQQVHAEHRPQISQAFILGNAISDPHTLCGPLYALDRHNLPPFLRHLGDRRVVTLRSDALYLLATDGFWACTRPDRWVASWPALLHGEPGGSADAVLDTLFGHFLAAPLPGLHADNLTAVALRFNVAARSAPGDAYMDETALPE